MGEPPASTRQGRVKNGCSPIVFGDLQVVSEIHDPKISAHIYTICIGLQGPRR
jgi:hypothetical protein